MQPGLPLTRADSFITSVRYEYSRKANTTHYFPPSQRSLKYILILPTPFAHTHPFIRPVTQPSCQVLHFPNLLDSARLTLLTNPIVPLQISFPVFAISRRRLLQGVLRQTKKTDGTSSLLSSQSAMRYTYVREIKMQMHDSSCATQHLCMMGEFDLRCSWVCTKYKLSKGAGKQGVRLQLVQSTLRQAASLFPSGLLRLPAPSWGASNADHAKPIHKPLYLTSTKRPIWRAFKKIYFVLLRVPKSLLVVFAKILVVVVVGNDNISSCRSEVGSRGRGSGDISSLASCCLTLTPAFVPQPLSPTIIIHGSCEQSPTISET